MRTFQLLGVASLAFGLLGACERKETITTHEVATAPPTSSTPAVETTAPVDRVPSSLDEKQPVAGHEMPATASPDIYTANEDGTRHMLHDSILITEVQRKLQNEGVYSGATDGRTSAELESSIRQFQAKKGLAQTGALDRPTTEALGLEWNRFEYKSDTGIGADVKKAGSELIDDTKQGAKEIGREIKEGAEKAGTKIESGTKKAGEKIREGADKVKEETAPTKSY